MNAKISEIKAKFSAYIRREGRGKEMIFATQDARQSLAARALGFCCEG